VERSAYAGLPSSGICLSCHSQLYTDQPVLAALRESVASGKPLAWRRVHQLPDFVFFDHSVHVRNGVACVECHGRVDQMPLTWRVAPLQMQWCLGCHRNAGPHVGPPSKVFSMDPQKGDEVRRSAAVVQHRPLPSRQRLTDCSTCHR
jgi:hypothetical protein